MVRVFRDAEQTEELEVGQLDHEAISALDSDVRKRILELISEESTFPAEVAREMDLGKQRAYYHFRKLVEADLIEKIGEKSFSGGTAQLYDTKYDALAYDLGSKGRKTYIHPDNNDILKFLDPLVSEGDITGNVVVGSPESHGEDQVRARDGHLAGEIATKLGNYGDNFEDLVVLDTQLHRTGEFDRNLLVLGGILTNTVAKKFNGNFPVKFSGESFPYREIETPEQKYEDSRIGFISKAENPRDKDKFIYIIAGVRREGTRAAVRAFREIEDLVEGYERGEFYAVVQGIDRSGDGRIDSFELLESGF